jgi:hypothetical protein
VILPLTLALRLAALPPDTTAAAEPAPPQAVTDLLAQRDPTWDRDLPRILAGESSGQGDVPNWRYDLRHTASGPLQITDTNWHAIAPRLGIDTTHYPTAMSAPRSWQLAVGKLMHRMYGLAPWDTAHGGSQPVAGRYVQRVTAWMAAPRFSIVAPGSAPSAPIAQERARMWRPYGRKPCACRPPWQPFRQDGDLQ